MPADLTEQKKLNVPSGLINPNGPSGPICEIGLSGPSGPSGSISPSGPSGASGAINPSGPSGPSGASGSNDPVVDAAPVVETFAASRRGLFSSCIIA